MGRWARENEFDQLVRTAHASFLGRVPVEAIKATIATESAFNPQAMPPATQADVSAGLMQLTLPTARALGYPGDLGDKVHLTGLFEPGTNLYLGTKLLDQLRSRLGADWQAVYSAYNGGIRPMLGFGARVTKPTTVCLIRDNTGKCIKSFTAQPGQFGNQPNVDRFKSALDYFFRNPPAPRNGGPGMKPEPVDHAVSLPLVAVLGIALGGLLLARGRQ